MNSLEVFLYTSFYGPETPWCVHVKSVFEQVSSKIAILVAESHRCLESSFAVDTKDICECGNKQALLYLGEMRILWLLCRTQVALQSTLRGDTALPHCIH